MRTLIILIIVFLLIRYISYAYFNRPSKRGPCSSRGHTFSGDPAGRRTSGSGRFSSSNRSGVDQAEEADFEIIEEKNKPD